MVNNVFFQDLKADFAVIAVQDDDIHLPEQYEVPLEDLFPIIEQENAELNVDRTADCLDELRLVLAKPVQSLSYAPWCETQLMQYLHLQIFLSKCVDAMG